MKYTVEENGFEKYLQRFHARKFIMLAVMVTTMAIVFYAVGEPENRPPVWVLPAIAASVLVSSIFVMLRSNKILRNFIGTEYVVTDDKLRISKDFQTIKEIDIATISGMRVRPEGLYIVTGKPGMRFNSYRVKRSLRHLTWDNTTLIPTHTTGFADLYAQLRKNRKAFDKK